MLREESRRKGVFEIVAGYVRENPLRANLIAEDEDLPDYPFAGCLVPGYPGSMSGPRISGIPSGSCIGF